MICGKKYFVHCLIVLSIYLVFILLFPAIAKEKPTDKTIPANKNQSTFYRLESKRCNLEGEAFTCLYIVLYKEDKKLDEVMVQSDYDIYPETVNFFDVIRLKENLNGLMIAQEIGFEHLKRRYFLWTSKNNKLKLDWSFVEGMGPHFTTYRIEDLNSDSKDEILFYHQKPTDEIEFQILGWEDEKIINQKDIFKKAKTYTTIFGSFKDFYKARKFESYYLEKECNEDLYFFSTNFFSKLSPDWIIFGKTSSTLDEAKRVLNKIKNCDSSISGYVKRAN